MNEAHPAMVAARGSWSAVQRKAKEEWLDLMADDVVIEDPIGASPLEPTGKGHCGKEAVSAFFENSHHEVAEDRTDQTERNRHHDNHRLDVRAELAGQQ